jgi:hypothetical protein
VLPFTVPRCYRTFDESEADVLETFDESEKRALHQDKIEQAPLPPLADRVTWILKSDLVVTLRINVVNT